MRLCNEDDQVGKEEAVEKDTSETELDITWISELNEVLYVVKTDSIEIQWMIPEKKNMIISVEAKQHMFQMQ